MGLRQVRVIAYAKEGAILADFTQFWHVEAAK
jgi:hypothetical protein